jgi:hypothetical protein
MRHDPNTYPPEVSRIIHDLVAAFAANTSYVEHVDDIADAIADAYQAGLAAGRTPVGPWWLTAKRELVK